MGSQGWVPRASRSDADDHSAQADGQARRCESVPQWLYDALSSFQSFMDRGSLLDLPLLLVLAAGGVVGLVFMHELGHAVAARMRGLQVSAISVGGKPLFTVPIGNVRVQIGWASGRGDVGGYMRYAPGRATPSDTLIIALAGPAGGFLGTAVCAWLAVALVSHGMVGVVAGVLAIQGVVMNLANLFPSGNDVDAWSDGRWAQISWSARRRGVRRWIATPDPNRATTVAPPQPPT